MHDQLYMYMIDLLQLLPCHVSMEPHIFNFFRQSLLVWDRGVSVKGGIAVASTSSLSISDNAPTNFYDFSPTQQYLSRKQEGEDVRHR